MYECYVRVWCILIQNRRCERVVLYRSAFMVSCGLLHAFVNGRVGTCKPNWADLCLQLLTDLLADGFQQVQHNLLMQLLLPLMLPLAHE